MFRTKRPIRMRFLFCLSLNLVLPRFFFKSHSKPPYNCFSCSQMLRWLRWRFSAKTTCNRKCRAKQQNVPNANKTNIMRCQCLKTTPKNDPIQVWCRTTRTKTHFNDFACVRPFLNETGWLAIWSRMSLQCTRSLSLSLSTILTSNMERTPLWTKHCGRALKVVSKEHTVGWREERKRDFGLESSLTLSWTLDVRFNHQNIHTLISSTPYGD